MEPWKAPKREGRSGFARVLGSGSGGGRGRRLLGLGHGGSIEVRRVRPHDGGWLVVGSGMLASSADLHMELMSQYPCEEPKEMERGWRLLLLLLQEGRRKGREAEEING